MKYKTVDDALHGLCTVINSSSYRIKQIAFSSGDKVDASMISATNHDNDLIPGSQIILAIETLKKCYNSLEEQMDCLFFMVHYGQVIAYLPQLIDGLSILGGVDKWLAIEILKGYQESMTPIEEIAERLGVTYNQSKYICRKVRDKLKNSHDIIKYKSEVILSDAGYILEVQSSSYVY